MPIFCFFCGRTLRESVRIIALIYLAFSLYHILWALYCLISIGSHWIYYLTLIVNVISLPFNALLFLGSKQERRDYVYIWMIFTVVVILPFIILLLAICVVGLQIWCIIWDLIALVARVYMWFQVRQYHMELSLAASDPSAPPANVNKVPGTDGHRGAGIV